MLTEKVNTLSTNIMLCVPAANAKAPSCERANVEIMYPKRVAESQNEHREHVPLVKPLWRLYCNDDGADD